MAFNYRRVVPTGYTSYKLSLTGETPLLMSSGEADRTSDEFIAYRQLSVKSKKTLEDEARLRELEWYTRLYHDEKIGPYIPGANIKGMLVAAARNWRQGANFGRSLIVPEYRIPLIYDGPRDPQKLWEAGFHHFAMVGLTGSTGRVERTRPMFEEWALECEIAIDPEDINPSMLESAVERAERKFGLGDWRPQKGGDFGVFTAKMTLDDAKKRATKAKGSKARDEKAERALKTHTKKIKTTA